MNDLFVPLILAQFPEWSAETGDPIGAVDVRAEIPIIFWNFEGMLRRTNHTALLSSVTERCREMAEAISQNLMKVAPLIVVFMRRYGLSDMMWMYSDFVLLFKRSFDDIWSTWVKLSSAPAPEHWVTYFAAAILLKVFPRFAALKDVQITSIMEEFAIVLPLIDPSEIGKISLWIHSQYPLTPTAQGKIETADKFEYFAQKDGSE
jgi:hypothetical protein